MVSGRFAVRGKATRGASALIALITLALVLTSTANAHRPWFNLAGSPDPDTPYELQELSVSQVVYGGLSGAGRVDYYRMDVPEGFSADIQLVVPDVATCASFRPLLVIAGPGLSSDVPLPEGLVLPGTWVTGDESGWHVVEGSDWGYFFEPVTRSAYATSPRFQESLAGGEYLIAIVEPEGDTGTYGLALGGLERTGGDPLFMERIGPINDCLPPVIPASPVASPVV